MMRSPLTEQQREILCVALLAAACIALWTPALHAISLNPDESQYEATASYLVATDTSAFLPNGAPGTFGLFKIATWLFGAYPIFEMRLLVHLIAFAIAWMLYRAVSSATTRFAGLLSGLVYLHLLIRFEGLAVNREWFASFFTMAGLALFLKLTAKQSRHYSVGFALSGLLCGLALWFKLQVSFMVFIAPLTMLLDLWQSRSWTQCRRRLLPFALGGIGAGLLYLIPFAIQGTLGQFLDFVFSDVAVFVEGNEQAIQQQAGAVSGLYLDRFFHDLPYRPLFLIAYIFAAGVALRRLIGRTDESDATRKALLFSGYLLLGMVSVKLGNRFFSHYYQLMLPAVAALVGLSASFFWKLNDRRRPIWWVVAVLSSALLLIDRFFTLQREPLWYGKTRWPEAGFTIAFVVLGGVVLLYWLRRPRRHAGRALVALLVVQTIVMIAAIQWMPPPGKVAFKRFAFNELTPFLKSRATDGDSLFVWGWAPEIYSLSRIEAASHITFCQYVANDLKGVPDRPQLNQEWAGLMMRELRESQPRFIVDAARRSWFETETDIYTRSNFEPFELNQMLDERYVLITTLDECDVWERR
jgi:4-amino-4-deoxy-L-arabinose transferase-like glycosyltransferase